MTDRNITLTLNGETRTVSAMVCPQYLIVGGIQMVTSSGTRAHIGGIYLKPKAADFYGSADIIHVNYHGMRGNGSGMRSRMRYIGFPKNE